MNETDLHRPYETLKTWHDSHIEKHQTSNSELNHFHDIVMQRLFDIALSVVEEKLGPPPCRFSWFVMGSAGRFEQAIVSDQDHGLVFQVSNEKSREYFRELGREISLGLYEIGYPYCDGDVMSSNPLWCKSEQEWEKQIGQWLEEESFESIRFLLIFYDARVLVGEKDDITRFKQQLHQYIEKRPHFLYRLFENTRHVKKAVGVFRQILTESHGSHAGYIDMKHSGFFPYINAIRLLAIKENIVEPSTLVRLVKLCEFPEYKKLECYKVDFEKLLHFRLQHHEVSEVYDDVHYLNVKKLDKYERNEIKQVLRNGKKLQDYTGTVIKRMLDHEN
ncbi:DUF294 nucleotidyltransferase-like domain-containing protein [Pseudalkalibacillus sp. A8]|uniref:DUF294 nucleotidyltransferase-like domain-containing protein n=1 Tax=Pseudalkalibacillus sp. A8 TaxID=3382641 RepID=UPI0038B5B967